MVTMYVDDTLGCVDSHEEATRLVLGLLLYDVNDKFCRVSPQVVLHIGHDSLWDAVRVECSDFVSSLKISERGVEPCIGGSVEGHHHCNTHQVSEEVDLVELLEYSNYFHDLVEEHEGVVLEPNLVDGTLDARRAQMMYWFGPVGEVGHPVGNVRVADPHDLELF